MKNTSTHLLLGAVGLLVANSPSLAKQTNASSVAELKMEALNGASLKSIESTWLAVPTACKARGFNADAVPLIHKEAHKSIQAIYASYEA